MKPPSKIVVPIRLSSWLNGDIGKTIERILHEALRTPAKVQRLHRCIVVEADEEPGVLLEDVHQATVQMEAYMHRAYPVFVTQMGSPWTGSLQAVFAAT